MLNYLNLRFFPASQMRPVDVLQQMKRLATSIDSLLKTGQALGSPQRASADGPPSPVVREILKSVQIDRRSLGPDPA
jgi:hypothetical protein